MDTISGGAMAVAAAAAFAKQSNEADDGAGAGNDSIASDDNLAPEQTGAADEVAGEAMARSQGQDGAATAVANNTADDSAPAGTRTIHSGTGANPVAGTAPAVHPPRHPTP